MIAIDIAKYDDVFRRLAYEAVACAPRTWHQGQLSMRLDGRGLHYNLESDPGQPTAVATKQLAELCAEVYLRMEMDGQAWSECLVCFTKSQDGSWNFEVKFKYPSGNAN